MKDTIEIRDNIIIAQLSYTGEQVETAFIGYIPSFDLPFTSPNKEKASEIAGGLVDALFNLWLKKGKVDFVLEKLEKYQFTQQTNAEQCVFEHSVPSQSIRIKEELYVI